MGKSVPISTSTSKAAVGAEEQVHDNHHRRSTELKKRKRTMEEEVKGDSSNGKEQRLPLSEVVADCVKRWFYDTLKEAKTGEFNMQVLVAQMYYNGYGVSKDANKGRIWMTKASRVRSSVWKVSNKRPGYNATDSDSDEPTCAS